MRVAQKKKLDETLVSVGSAIDSQMQDKGFHIVVGPVKEDGLFREFFFC